MASRLAASRKSIVWPSRPGLEEAIHASDPDASLIDTVGLRGRLEMMAATLLRPPEEGLNGTARPELASTARPRPHQFSHMGMLLWGI